MSAREFAPNALAALLDLKPGQDYRGSEGRRSAHRDPELTVPTSDHNGVATSLDARKTEFNRAAGMLFHPEGHVHGDAMDALRDLIPSIIRHHQQLRFLRKPQGGFDLVPAFSDAIRKMAAPNGDLMRPGIGKGESELITPAEFARGVKSICTLFKSDPGQVISSLEVATWLGSKYRNELAGVKQGCEKSNPKLQEARRLFGL